MIQIFHNNRCSKSRECLSFLEETGSSYQIIDYLKNPPDHNHLKILLSKLGISPIELVRKKEKIWIENYKGKTLSNDDIINAMVTYPILIERPIVVNGVKAVIARPAELASSII